jgi:hypothetical protein
METKKLIESYEFFYHSTNISNIDRIKKNGLLPHPLEKNSYCPIEFRPLNLICFANYNNILRAENGFFSSSTPTQKELEARAILRVKSSSITIRKYSLDYTDSFFFYALKDYLNNATEYQLFEIALNKIGTIACYEVIPFSEIEIVDRKTLI